MNRTKLFVLSAIAIIFFMSSCEINVINLDEEIESIDLYPVEVNGKWGYIDAKGNIVIPPKYRGGFDFSEGLAAFISDNGKSGFINKKGEVVIEPEFYVEGDFENGIAPVWLKSNESANIPYSYIDKTGQVIVNTDYLYVTNFREDLMCVSTNGEKYGFCDRDFNLVIEEQFAMAGYFSEGLANFTYEIDGKWGFIDKEGNVQIEPRFNGTWHFSEGLAAVNDSNNQRWGFINKRGDYVIQPKYYGAGDFKEGLAFVGVKNDDNITQFGYINEEEEFVIEHIYRQVRNFSEGLAAVVVNISEGIEGSNPVYKWGYIDKTGSLIIHPQYDSATEFKNGIARVYLKGKGSNGYINNKGEYIWEPR